MSGSVRTREILIDLTGGLPKGAVQQALDERPCSSGGGDALQTSTAGSLYGSLFGTQNLSCLGRAMVNDSSPLVTKWFERRALQGKKEYASLVAAIRQHKQSPESKELELFSLHNARIVSRWAMTLSELQNERLLHLQEKYEALKAAPGVMRTALHYRFVEIPSFPALTMEQQALVNRAWSNASDSEILVQGFDIEIRRRDAKTLRMGEWLNDEIINFYFNLIMERSLQTKCKVYAFSTFFYPKLAKMGYSSLRRWTRRVDIFSYDMILVPLHMESIHWTLGVIDFTDQTIKYYDSLIQSNKQCLDRLQEYLHLEHKDKKGTDFAMNMQLVVMSAIPKQQNGYDCGVFACKFAEYASRHAEINFTQMAAESRLELELSPKAATLSRFGLQHFVDGVIDFFAGTAAGVACVYSGQPLDTVKVKMQTFPELYSGMNSCLAATFRQDGIRGLYAGSVPALAANVAENSVVFLAYGFCQKFVALLARKERVADLHPAESACAGSLAAVFGALVLCPTELVKCRLQSIRETHGGVRTDAGVLSVTRNILRQEGVRGLFHGLLPTFAREVPGYFFFFGSYEFSRYLIAHSVGRTKDDINPIATCLCGGLGGVAFWMAIYPADVIKSRVQIYGAKHSMLKMVALIVRNEGFLALYKGLWPTVIRTFIASGALFLAYETVQRELHRLADPFL